MHARTAIHRGSAAGHRGAMRGVTLIELMVVIVIIGILVAIAYPGYQSQIQRTRRADGKAALMNTAQQLERCFTRFNVYNNAACDIATTLAGGGFASTEGWYVITDAAPAANGFSLVATPQGAQTDDTQCANLTLTSTGTRGASGTAPATCW
jgi:type IV pilus assembly protein PilE